MKTCYSHNEEDFHSDMETALDLAVEDFLGCSPDFEGETEIELFEGEKDYKSISAFLPKISERIEDRAYGESDDYAKHWRKRIEKNSAEIQKTLSAALENWANLTNNQPNFFGVKNVQPISVKIKVDKSGEWTTL